MLHLFPFFLNQASAGLWAGVHMVSMNWYCPRSVCVCVCLPPRLAISSGVIWNWTCHVKSIRKDETYIYIYILDPLRYYSFCMAAIIDIVSRRGLRIEARCRNHPNKSKLSLYKPLLHLYSHLQQLYISNNTKRLSYKSGCGVRGRTLIEAFKRRAGLGYI